MRKRLSVLIALCATTVAATLTAATPAHAMPVDTYTCSNGSPTLPYRASVSVKYDVYASTDKVRIESITVNWIRKGGSTAQARTDAILSLIQKDGRTLRVLSAPSRPDGPPTVSAPWVFSVKAIWVATSAHRLTVSMTISLPETKAIPHIPTIICPTRAYWG
jgi:hypothetical protein